MRANGLVSKPARRCPPRTGRGEGLAPVRQPTRCRRPL